MKKLLFISIMSLLFYKNSYTQETTKERKNAIGISGGTGFGVDYSRKISNKIFFTLAYNSLEFSKEGIEQEVSGQDLLIDAALEFKSINFKINYHPFESAFKLVGGVGSFSSNSINISTSFQDEIAIGEVTFNTEDAGSLNINAAWGEIVPYVGMGFGRAVSKKRIGFVFEFGSYISSSPEITLDASGIIEQTNDQEALLNESFESFKFIPYASFRLSYSF